MQNKLIALMDKYKSLKGEKEYPKELEFIVPSLSSKTPGAPGAAKLVKRGLDGVKAEDEMLNDRDKARAVLEKMANESDQKILIVLNEIRKAIWQEKNGENPMPDGFGLSNVDEALIYSAKTFAGQKRNFGTFTRGRVVIYNNFELFLQPYKDTTPKMQKEVFSMYKIIKSGEFKGVLAMLKKVFESSGKIDEVLLAKLAKELLNTEKAREKKLPSLHESKDQSQTVEQAFRNLGTHRLFSITGESIRHFPASHLNELLEENRNIDK